uniref:Uncharacterized protein n=1 Tax=Anopheles minimus TaxID=112268 RepID=A0A182W3Q0_9DIPT
MVPAESCTQRASLNNDHSSLETTALQKKYLEQKNKRSLKKTEKKQAEQQQLQQQQTLSGNLQSSVHVLI